jgi:S1-C subfamily serine protease
LTGVDNALGALLQGTVVLVLAWVIALLTQVSGLPQLASAISGSTVLGAVNNAMPAEAKGIPKQLGKILDSSGFPSVVEPFTQTPLANVPPPDPRLQASPVVQQVHQSVLKVRGQASSCQRVLEGSGFVISPHRVVTNAHVVAGTDKVYVEVGNGQLDATVVSYDPETDIAVLAVPGLSAAPLPFASSGATMGEDAIVLGYPLDGPYTAASARVRDRINLRGPDIYDARTVVRDVYTVRATVKSGNSGGPLIDSAGKVLGVVFGAAVDNPDTGFVLTDKQIAPQVAAAPSLTQPVSTGRCAA